METWKQVFDLEDDWVIAFLDIVGFSNAIITCQNATMEDIGGQINLSKISQDIIKRYDSTYQQENKVRFLWVSDSIFLATKKEHINQMFLEIDHILNIMYCSHFSVRGGIAYGKLHFEENVWGPALLKAVDIEKTTTYPRISIEKEIIDQLNISDNYRKFLINIPQSDYAYYDYFGSFIRQKLRDSKAVDACLSVYSKMIAENFSKCVLDKHKKKWAFLCERLIEAININADRINAQYEASFKNCATTPHLTAQGYIDNMKNVIKYIS